MTKNSSRKKHNGRAHHPGGAVIGPAPYLKKTRAVFCDSQAVAGSGDSGDVIPILSGNGYAVNDLSPVVP